MDVSDKIFINSAWTAASKVPQESAQGVKLVFGVNAFASIAAAKAALGSLDGKGIYLLNEKSVKLGSADKYGMISSQEPYAVLSYKESATGFYDAVQVKLAAAGDIAVTGDTDMIIQGYKNVDINSTANYAVIGGNGLATNAYTYLDKGGATSEKREFAVNSVAGGNLTVTNATVAPDGFLFDYSNDTIGWFSSKGEADIVPGMAPARLATFANVTLTAATATDFNGGSYKGNAVDTLVTDAAGGYSSSYKYAFGNSTSGKLTLTKGAAVGVVGGYADVSVTSASKFAEIDGTVFTRSYDYTDVYKDKGGATARSIAVKSSETERSTGKVVVSDASAGDSIVGYATVTVTDSLIGYAEAGATNAYYKYNSEENANGSAASYKASSTDNDAAAQSGVLTAVDAVFGSDIVGYNKITLTGTEVGGAIAATAEDDGSGMVYGRAFTESELQNNSSATNASGEETMTSDDKYTRIDSATGTVAVTSGTVAGGIIGYSNVTVTASEIGGEISAENAREDATDTYKRIYRKDVETITSASTERETENAVGALTVTASVVNDIDIEGFQKVTLTNVAGTIVEAEGGNSDENTKSQSTFVNGIETMKSGTLETATAVGNFTAKNTIPEVIAIGGDVEGFSKVDIARATVGGSIVGGNYIESSYIEARNLEDASAIVTPFSSDYVEGAETYLTTRKLTGSATIAETEVSGNIEGYAAVTLSDGSVVGGDINDASPINYKTVRDFRRNIESQYVSESKAPATTLTMKTGTAITGTAYNIAKLTMESGTNLGAVDMITSNHVIEEYAAHASKGDTYARKEYENVTGAGALTINSGTTIGAIYGAKTVNVTSAAIGDLDAFTTTMSSLVKGVSKPGDVLTVDAGISDPYALASYESTSKETKTAIGAATLNTAVIGDLAGFAKVTATDTDLNGAIEGGKRASVATEKYTNTEKGSAVVITDVYNTSYTALAQGVVTANGGNVDGASIEGFQNVTLTRVEGAAAEVEGGNTTYVSTDSQYISSGVVNDKFVGSATTVAAGAFTATGVSSGADPVLSFAEIDGFTTVKLTSANVESSIVAENVSQKTTVELNDSVFAGSETTYVSKYTGSVDIATNILQGSATVGENINGYATVTLDAVVVGGAVNAAPVDESGDPAYEWLSTKDTVAVRGNKENPFVSYSGTYSSSTVAATALTLKNGAIVTEGANNINKLTMGAGTEIGDVVMVNSSTAGNRAIALKGDIYNASEKTSDTQMANGVVVITGNSSVSTVAGNIAGAKAVSATWAVIGDITNGWTTEEAAQITASNVTVDSSTYTFTGGESGSVKDGESQIAKAKVVLTDTVAGYVAGATTVDLTRSEIAGAAGGAYKYAGQSSWTKPDFATWKVTYNEMENAAGTFNATSSYVTSGDVEGFAKVALTDTEVAGGIYGGNWSAKGGLANGSGTRYESEVAAGTLTATDSLIGGTISEYGSVKLTDAEVGGSVIAGNHAWTFDWDWNPIEDEVVVAAGNLTAVDTIIAGDVADFKTAVFDGDNFIGGSVFRVAGFGVKSGVTAVAADESFIGGDANENVTIAANGILQVTKMDLGDGKDAVSIAGTLRVLGADDTTLVGIEKIAGNGLLAVTNDYYTGDLKAALNGVAVDKALTIVNAGSETGVKSIRTKAEELGDNGGAAIAMANDDIEFGGWLCADADYGFVDTIDWVSFTQNSGESFSLTIDDTYSDAGQLEIGVYKNGVYVGDDSALSGLADGSYEMKLELKGTTAGPLAYTLTRA